MGNVGDRIRNRREELGYSQEFIAAELGVTQPTYARIESGTTVLSLERAVVLASILNISILDLIGAEARNMVVQNTEVKDNGQIIHTYQGPDMALYHEMFKELQSQLAYMKEEVERYRKQEADSAGKSK